MEQMLERYGFPKETVTAITTLYRTQRQWTSHLMATRVHIHCHKKKKKKSHTKKKKARNK